MLQVTDSNAVLGIQPLLTIKDIAHLERVSKATIYRRVKAGFYPRGVVRRLGPLIRFRPEAYAAFLRGDLVPGEGAPPQLDPQGEQLAAGPGA